LAGADWPGWGLGKGAALLDRPFSFALPCPTQTLRTSRRGGVDQALPILAVRWADENKTIWYDSPKIEIVVLRQGVSVRLQSYCVSRSRFSDAQHTVWMRNARRGYCSIEFLSRKEICGSSRFDVLPQTDFNFVPSLSCHFGSPEKC
jgi:hypothetical protein